MWRKLAAIAVLPSMITLAAPAHATPPNYAVFLQAIASDGIVIDGQQGISEGRAVCKSMAPPNGGSLWDAAQQVKSMHPDWKIDASLKFANRATQNICPDRDSFE